MTRFALCAHLGYLFTELPLEDRFAAAATAGFRHVEHPALYALSARRVAALCAAHDLRMVQIGLPMGGEGEKGLAALPGREADFAHTLETAITYAMEIGCPLIHPMAGVPPKEADTGDVARTYHANLALACSRADDEGLEVIVEPIGPGTLAGYYVNHPDRALADIAAVGASNLLLSFDAFHAAQAGVDIAAFARTHARSIAHVQIADAPGRHEPGTGTIDFTRFFEGLAEGGYGGVVGLEYHPAQTTADSFDWIARYADVLPLT